MISYTQALTTLQSFLKYNSTDSTNNTFVLSLFNDSVRAVCAIRPWWFLWYTKDITAVASQPAYSFPARLKSLTELYATVGTTVYRPQPIYDEEKWTRIKQAYLGESDAPMFYHVRGNSFEVAPTPASTSVVFTLRGRTKVRDVSVADVTSPGTISAVTNGGTTITGSSTSWNSTMIGRMIRITNGTSTNLGDGYWYEITGVASATSLTIAEPYEGTTITAGSANYTISEVYPIPEEWQLAVIYRTVALYMAINDPANPKISVMWWRLYDGGEEAGLAKDTGGILAKMKEVEGATNEDKYLTPSYKDIDPNYPPRDITGLD